MSAFFSVAEFERISVFMEGEGGGGVMYLIANLALQILKAYSFFTKIPQVTATV